LGDGSVNTAHCIADELGVREVQVRAVLALFAQGCTVPFIARYRKEATGSLDETVIAAVRDRNERLVELEKRRASIIESLSSRGILTPALRAAVDAARTSAALEDAYLPYRPKRKTRAAAAAEKGLAPLADLLFAQKDADGRLSVDPDKEAKRFVSRERGVESAADALSGALDILAERFSEDPDARTEIRKVFARKSVLVSSGLTKNDAQGEKYRDYFDRREQAAAMPSHRVLAIFRGEREGFLRVSIAPPEDDCLAVLKRMFVKGTSASSRLVARAVTDGYRRLLRPSMENELRAAMKKRADAEAIRIFADNVREVLMSPPMGHKATLAIDPGIRTGCKVVCLDDKGALLHSDVVFLRRPNAAGKLLSLIKKYSLKAVAIGNGTGGREAEDFVRGMRLPKDVIVASVNESGASVYSASESARNEFPDSDITVRGAVSIGRRLMDPLAELVKIDPKSIGVGQYQHDVDQKELRRSLDDVVIGCVNAVGVDVNTAPVELLSYVSGLNMQTASALVKYRSANGAFRSREELKKVPRLGPKTFEQAAGFLRINILGQADGPPPANPLDASAVHPENYHTVERMAKAMNCSVSDLIARPDLRSALAPRLSDFVSETAGLPTLKDILLELAKPGRDPRSSFEPLAFDPHVRSITDLRVGMVLSGVVTNVAAFGAFVDVGVHNEGLIHVSRMADGRLPSGDFAPSPHSSLYPGQHVTVVVTGVDLERKRIALSMRKSDFPQGDSRPRGNSRPQEDSRPRGGHE
jgi:uncharacterized protein